MLTLVADNGELTLISAPGSFILDAVQETPVGRDVVHAKKTTLVLSRRDAAKLRRALGAMLRKPRPQAATASAMAEECAQ